MMRGALSEECLSMSHQSELTELCGDSNEQSDSVQLCEKLTCSACTNA